MGLFIEFRFVFFVFFSRKNPVLDEENIDLLKQGA